MKKNRSETYLCCVEKHGRGMFFFTDCGAMIYSVKAVPDLYHGCLCPKCANEGKEVTLYLKGTKEGNEVMVREMKERKRKNVKGV